MPVHSNANTVPRRSSGDAKLPLPKRLTGSAVDRMLTEQNRQQWDSTPAWCERTNSEELNTLRHSILS